MLSREELTLIMPTEDSELVPTVHHAALETTFRGIIHPLSTNEAPIHQFRGIKYASVPARFRQSKLFGSYSAVTDATKCGPICPQVRNTKSTEEILFGLADSDIPKQALKQNEFECLNLNITCPTGLNAQSRVPVMVWVHGGGDRGSGSSWVYDGGSLVRKSILMGKPIIMVTFNFRIGLFGFAASPQLKEDNKAAGDDGVGNYGLRDQRRALDWLHHFITDFGGDPTNITLFGESTGGADIVAHLLSARNETRPLFHRAVIQSAVIDPCLPEVANAGWHLSRLMSALHISTIEQLRSIDADNLVPYGQSLRAVDDGIFFRTGWKQSFVLEDAHLHSHHVNEYPSNPKSRPSRSSRSTSRPGPVGSRGTQTLQLPDNLQPLIIGDCAADALLWSLPASMWSSAGVVRRLKAICQSLTKASHLLHAYDISSYTDNDEISDRVLELINDARIAWPTECVAQNAKRDRGGRGVWRYVFDQEGPSRGVPHHAADLIYLFDNVPLPESARPSSGTLTATSETFPETFCSFDVDEEEELELNLRDSDENSWAVPSVDAWSYARVRDTIQERWVSFAHGEAPWNEEKVFVFGPEGETGERSSWIFEGRRRKHIWKEALEPLGMQIVQKVGVELSRGPPLG